MKRQGKHFKEPEANREGAGRRQRVQDDSPVEWFSTSDRSWKEIVVGALVTVMIFLGVWGLAAATAAVDTTPPVGRVVIRSVSAGTPADDATAYGMVKTRCSTCHGISKIENANFTTYAGWKGIVDKHVSSFGLSLTGTEATLFAGYLDRVYSAVAGDVSSATTAVTLYSEANDAGGVVSMRYSNDGVFDDTAGAEQWRPYVPYQQWTLSPGNGTKTVYAQFRDVAGNISAVITDSISLNVVALTGAMSLNSGAAYAGSSSVTINSSVVGAVEMRVDTGSGFGAWETYSATKLVELPAGDGFKTVNIEYRDSAGGTLFLSDSITVDTTPPSGSLVINNGDAVTATTGVGLTLLALDGSGSGVTDMRLSNDGAFDSTTEAWRPLSATALWNLTTGDGEKTVYAQFRDRAGNLSAVASDTISLILQVVTSPPPSIDLPDVEVSSPRFSTSVSSNGIFTVRWKLAEDEESAEDSNGSDYEAEEDYAAWTARPVTFELQVKSGADGAWQNWLSETASASAEFSAAPGMTYFFRGRAKDDRGNVGAWSSSAMTIVPFDEDSGAFVGSWSSTMSPGSPRFMGTSMTTTERGAQVSFAFVGRRFYLLVTKSPLGGKARVYVDGVHRATIETKSARTKYRQLIKVADIGGASSPHLIRVVNLAKNRRNELVVDGFAVVQ